MVDWFTVGAQIFNFLLLLYLLKRFLYGPIQKAMAAREARIAQAAAAARAAMAEAEKRAAELAAEQKSLESAKVGYLDEARREVADWKRRAEATVQAEVEAARRDWHQRLDREKAVFVERLKTRIVAQIAQVSQKVLTDLAEEKLERQLVSVFLRKLGTQAELKRLKGVAGTVRVRSGVPLAAADAARLEEQLKEWLPRAGEVAVSVDREMGLGLELLAGDYKVEWNLKDYLAALEKDITGLLMRADGQGTWAGTG